MRSGRIRSAFTTKLRCVISPSPSTFDGRVFDYLDGDATVLEREPLRLLMAPSGVDKGRMQADHLIQVNRDGAVISGSGKASAETLLHLRIIDEGRRGPLRVVDDGHELDGDLRVPLDEVGQEHVLARRDGLLALLPS